VNIERSAVAYSRACPVASDPKRRHSGGYGYSPAALYHSHRHRGGIICDHRDGIFLKCEGLLDELPPFPSTLLAKLDKPHLSESSDKPEVDPELVAAALGVIPNTEDIGYSKWKIMGMATWGATGGSEEGFAAFDE
jgi:hypothetical protein